jgi:transcriptional regulator with XRE-family HTH domain
MNADPGSLGRVLLHLRIARGVKALDLAAASGVDRARISNYESGLKTPGHLVAARLIRALGYRPSVIQLAHDFAFGLEEYEVEGWERPTREG